MSVIVASFLAHLKELEESMKLEESCFKQEDIENCDVLAGLLQDLENEVKKCHEELETETIKTNLFRHKMRFLNYDLQKEIEENLRVARESNKAVILDLKEKLDLLNKNIQMLNEKDEFLTTKIKEMEPEKQALLHDHERIIGTLNDEMASRASGQIKLNETRDTLRETNQTILSLEDEIMALKQQLIKEKAEARDEKSKLEEKRLEANDKAASQEDFNKEKAREVVGVKSKLDESNKSLRVVYRENERLEHLITEMLLEIQDLNTNFVREQKELEELANESSRLIELEKETKREFEQTKEETINKTKEASERAILEAENVRKLKEEQDVKREDLKVIHQSYKELQAVNEAIKKAIDALKYEIGEKLKEIAQIESKNQAIYIELGQAQETHDQMMDSLQREAEECREQLIYEREFRIKKQQEREAKLAEIEEFNANAIAFQSEIDKYFANAKETHQGLTQKDLELNVYLEENEKEKKRLLEELEKTQKRSDQNEEQLGGYLNKLEKDIENFTKENNRLSKEIADYTPEYTRLCQTYADNVKDYEKHKNELAAAKIQKHDLETAINTLNKQLGEQDRLKNKLSTSLNEKREESLNKMNNQNEEMKLLETKILNTGLQTYTLKKENDKFLKAVGELEDRFRYFESRSIDALNDKKALQKEYELIHAQLLEGWKNDEEIEQLFVAKDSQLISKLNDLLNKSQTREDNIENVRDKLNKKVYDIESTFQNMLKSLQPVTEENTAQQESN